MGRQNFSNVRKPSAVQNEIYKQMEANENRKFDRVNRSAPAAAPAAESDPRPDRQARPAPPAGRPHPGRVRRQEAAAPRPHVAGVTAQSTSGSRRQAVTRHDGQVVGQGSAGLDQRDDAAAEAGAGEAGADHAVRGGQPLRPARRAPGCSPRSRRAGCGGWRPSPRPSRARSPLAERVGQLRRRAAFSVMTWRARRRTTSSGSWSRSSRVAPRSGPMSACARLAGGRPLGVGARRQLPALAGVDHDHLDVVGHRDRRDLERRAVDPQGVARDAGGAGELVHDPAGHPGRPLLGALARAGQVERRAVEPERQRHGHLQGGRRRQARADRQRRRRPIADEPDRWTQLGHDAGDVPRPARVDAAAGRSTSSGTTAGSGSSGERSVHHVAAAVGRSPSCRGRWPSAARGRRCGRCGRR